VLAEPDPNWGKRPHMHHLACADSVSTPDGGKTWKIGTIRVKESKAPEGYRQIPPNDTPAICVRG
jgi:hypothetical protein